MVRANVIVRATTPCDLVFPTEFAAAVAASLSVNVAGQQGCGPDFVVEFLSRLGTCHACGCDLIVDMGCRHCIDGCPSSCEDCDEPHDDLTSRDYEHALDLARQQADTIRNLAKLVQRLSRKCTVELLRKQAIEYLDRNGLNEHSILR